MQQIIESTELSDIVGIQPILLNKFVERGQYGIRASVRTGRGRGSRRLFNEEDVFGVALVWWLFESGLRSKTIQFVLDHICRGKRGSSANDAAKIIIEHNVEVLAIVRQPRTAREQRTEHPTQRVVLTNEIRVSQLIKDATTESVLALPVGSLLSNLKAGLKNLSAI